MAVSTYIYVYYAFLDKLRYENIEVVTYRARSPPKSEFAMTSVWLLWYVDYDDMHAGLPNGRAS